MGACIGSEVMTLVIHVKEDVDAVEAVLKRMDGVDVLYVSRGEKAITAKCQHRRIRSIWTDVPGVTDITESLGTRARAHH